MPSASVQLMSLLMRVARRAGSDLDREFAGLGVTSQQAAVLVNIHIGHATPQELSRVLATDPGGITRLIDRLVDGGLVERVPSTTDRRAVNLLLTEHGRSLVPAIPERYEAVAARLATSLDDDAVRTLHAWLLSAATSIEGNDASDEDARS